MSVQDLAKDSGKKGKTQKPNGGAKPVNQDPDHPQVPPSSMKRFWPPRLPFGPYGWLMILMAIPMVGFHHLFGPPLGLSRLEALGVLASVILLAAVVAVLTRQVHQTRDALGVLPLLLLLMLVAGIAIGDLSWLAAVATVVLGLLCFHFAGLLTTALKVGEKIHVERHWRLGGAAGGWQTTRTTVYLAATLGFGILLSAVLAVDSFSPKNMQTDERQAPEQTTESPSPTGTTPPDEATESPANAAAGRPPETINKALRMVAPSNGTEGSGGNPDATPKEDTDSDNDLRLQERQP